MTVSKILSATPCGFQGQLIEIEGDLSKGLPSIQIVGLGNKAIDEAKDRVRSAIKNSLLDSSQQLPLPKLLRETTLRLFTFQLKIQNRLSY